MWIQLTDANGQPLALNTEHVVTVQAYGERTKITHVGGQSVVAESVALVLTALGLLPLEQTAEHEQCHKLHS
ncbi:flagellar FlbD family protein [Aliihoeflea sp. PC F10.4]